MGADTRFDGVATARERAGEPSAELLTAAAAGEKQAMRELLDIVVPMVTRFCRVRAGAVRDSALCADDIAQEAVLGIVAALPRFVPGSRPFLAFAMRVAANKVYDAHRSSARLRTSPLPEGVEWADPAPEPAERAERLDVVATARKLLDGLSDRQRDIVVLRLVCEMSAEEVGAAIGTSAGAVRVAQHRALATMRERAGDRPDRSVTPAPAPAISGREIT